MSRGSSLGWQTSLADLSLVLFLVAAASVSRHHAHEEKMQKAAAIAAAQTAKPKPAGATAPVQSEPVAVYAATPDAPPLAEWLSSQAVDPRQQLTITAYYGSERGAQAKALSEAARLLADAKSQGRSARVVIEPGAGPASVALAYDVSSPIGG